MKCHFGDLSSIEVSPNGRYFITVREDRPLFFLGDTLWELFRIYSEEEAFHILRKRTEQGFNVILIMLTGAPILSEKGPIPDLAPNINGHLPWLDCNPLTPNEEYFDHVDKIIKIVAQSGHVMIVGVYHKAQDPYFTPSTARAWARWISQRYKDVPNLIWCMYPTASDEWKPICKEIAAGLVEGDNGAHLITMHPDPAVASSSFMHGEEWLSFNMIQTCVEYDRILETVSHDYHLSPAKPVIMAEGGYEGVEFGKTQTAHDMRKQAWWSYLAGAYFVYGHNDCWVAPTAWRRWIDAPGANQMKVFKEIASSVNDWWDRVPDQSLLLSGAGEGYRLNVVARDAHGRWIMAYTSSFEHVRLRLDAITASRSCKVLCVNPADGTRLVVGNYNCVIPVEIDTPAGWEDAIIIAQAIETV